MSENYLTKVSAPADNHYELVRLFCMGFIAFSDGPFTSEQIIEAYKLSIYPQPREYRVFGAVIKNLKKEGWLEFHGYGVYKNPSGHSKPVNVWIKKNKNDH